MILKPNQFKPDYKLQKEMDYIWADTIKHRDNYSCAICVSTFHPNAHHIIPRENKQFRYLLDNGLTLCTSHHKFSRRISAHNNPFAFFLWLQKFYPNTFLAAAERTKEMLKKEGIVL